jgi:hypothetical protein
MATPNWVTEQDWDTLILGGERMPGAARVEVDMRGCLDKRKARGARRSKPRDTGAQPAQVDIELTLLPADMPEFERRLPVIRPRASGAPMDPLAIAHPNTRLWGVNSVLIDSVSSPMPTTGGYLRIRIKALEWVPEAKAVKKPKTAPKEGSGKSAKELADALNQLPMSQNPPAVEENFFQGADDLQSNGF